MQDPKKNPMMLTEQPAAASQPSPPGPQPLRVPRFRVTTWLWVTGICAVWLAAARWLPPAVVAASLLVAIVVLAHIAANAVGTALRGGPVRPAQPAPVPVATALPLDTATSRLRHRGAFGWFMIVCSIVGGIAGAAVGGWWLARANWQYLSLGSLLLAVGSCGILGALVGFWISSFSQVVLQTLIDAHRHH